MTEIECVLKAENFAVAARLDVSGCAVELLQLSAFWRAQALKLKAKALGLPIQRNIAPRLIWMV